MILKNNLRAFVPVILLFIVVNALTLILAPRLAAWNISEDVLAGGNLFLFIITFFSFLIAIKGLHHKNPNVFMRSVIGSITVKMFLAAIAAFIYIFVYKKELNKAALFICMGLYLVYTFLEVSILTRMLRRKPNE